MRSLATSACYRRAAALLLLIGMTAAACNRGAAEPPVLETREGLASFYGKALHGDETASGETFDMHEMVAAHPSWPFGTRVRVTNLENERQATVTVIDRGPVDAAVGEGVIIDLSRGAARELAFVEDGRARVQLEVLEWGEKE